MDWTQVLVALIAAVPATIAAVGVWVNHWHLRTPSGDRIGAITERTEHLASASVAHSTVLVEALNGGVTRPDA